MNLPGFTGKHQPKEPIGEKEEKQKDFLQREKSRLVLARGGSFGCNPNF